MSIGRKYSILVVVLLLVACVSIAIYSYITSSNTVTEASENTLYRSAYIASERLDEWLDNRVNVLNELSRMEGLEDMDIEEQREALQGEAERLGFLDIGIVEPDETGYTQYIEDEEADAELGDRDYVQTALEGEPNSSNVIISRVIDAPVLMHAVPIYDEAEEIVGIMIARDLAETIQEVTDGLGYGETGYSYIFGEDGTFFAHPDMELVMEEVNIFEDESTQDFGRAIEELDGEDGVVSYDYEGITRYQGVSRMDNGWYVAVGMEDVEFLAPIYTMRNAVIVFTAILIIVATGISLYGGRKMISPISKLDSMLNQMADYDFSLNSEELSGLSNKKDEVGSIASSMIKMQKNVVKLIDNINDKSEQVAASSQELSANTEENKNAADEVSKAVEQIAEGASNQAERTEQTSISTEEFGNMINNEQQYVKELNTKADETDELKEEGLKVVENLSKKTAESNKASESIYNTVIATKESADNIGQAVDTIKDIAEQTNLLALNASIEAARAGETGAGFAVVADEIRKLAENANENSEKISDIVHDLNEKSNHAVNTMKEVQGIVTEQNQGVENTRSKFNDIANSIQNVKEIAKVLTETGQHMQEKKKEIIDGLQDLASVAEENSSSTEEISSSVEEQTASMEEISRASEQLANLAEGMQQEISKFKY
ncbi:methyl-accepting chemotaxis protein [Natranaerofaba carboxydovora]|uniref:methyl-accepting chemotaxis protein n=1 Tax=Natranaerofaba carboxydovora TaxID=2742683 RepID=UPI001F1389B3|nr:methyl-accepting chemotaxis protein [Natranaerofaba carboxydovora]UMZ72499.1 Methyl-accepting chemotaxis protein McpC [Natranaerofaba carboxydovora]